MNRALGHLCAHIGWTGPGGTPEDGEMIEMTLSSRHRIRNSSSGGLRPLSLGHGGSPPPPPTILTFTHGWGRNIFCFFQTAETGNRTPKSDVKGSGANHYSRAPAPLIVAVLENLKINISFLFLSFTKKGLTNRLLGYERVHLTLYKVADTPFHIQGEELRESFCQYTSMI